MRAYEPQLGPGPDELVAGDQITGYYGELTESELISYTDLVTATGVSQGTSTNQSPSWFKFILDERVLFVPKTQILHSISWDHLNSLGCIFGEMEIQVQDQNFKVRVLKGLMPDFDPTVSFSNTGEFDPEATHGSEWNRLIYKLCVTLPSSQSGDNWEAFSENALLLSNSLGNANWCQEVLSDDTAVIRGTGVNVQDVRTRGKTNASEFYGWRPVLELIT